jgi:hypothetical protein
MRWQILSIAILATLFFDPSTHGQTLQYRLRGGGGGRSNSPGEPSAPIDPGTGGVGAIPAPGEGGVTDKVLADMDTLRRMVDMLDETAAQEQQDSPPLGRSETAAGLTDEGLFKQVEVGLALNQKETPLDRWIDRFQRFLIRYLPLLTAVCVVVMILGYLRICRSVARSVTSIERDRKEITDMVAQVREATKRP